MCSSLIAEIDAVGERGHGLYRSHIGRFFLLSIETSAERRCRVAKKSRGGRMTKAKKMASGTKSGKGRVKSRKRGSKIMKT
jgi:hypothetical protein